MEPADAEDDRGPTRRGLMAGGLAIGAVLAGCASAAPGVRTQDEEIARLEAEIAALERELEEYRHRLDTWNIWGFSDPELDRLQTVADRWTDSVLVIDVFTSDGHWSTGTGWVYDETTIATNAHVVRP